MVVFPVVRKEILVKSFGFIAECKISHKWSFNPEQLLVLHAFSYLGFLINLNLKLE